MGHCQIVNHLPNFIPRFISIELLNQLSFGSRFRQIFMKRVNDKAVVNDTSVFFYLKPVRFKVLFITGDILVGPHQVMSTIISMVAFNLPTKTEVGYFLPSLDFNVFHCKINDAAKHQFPILLQLIPGKWCNCLFLRADLFCDSLAILRLVKMMVINIGQREKYDTQYDDHQCTKA